MSQSVQSAPPAAPRDRSIKAAREARLAKFEREKLIVEYLNRGVSIPEIAAQMGVGEKHLRALIRDILARRMPAPPAEFLAMQVSRLNEALLVAYSAMSGMNLKAVDRVVKIVRELDRYHGFVAAERRFPGRARLEAPEESPLLEAFLAGRLQMAPQALEKIGSGPEDRITGEASEPQHLEAKRGGEFASVSAAPAQHSLALSPFETPASRAPQGEDAGVLGSYGGLEMAPQSLEKIGSGPEDRMAGEALEPHYGEAAAANGAVPERAAALGEAPASHREAPAHDTLDALSTERIEINPQA